jgi:hypothetical protein
MVPNSDPVAILEREEGFVPFQHILSTLLFLEKNLWAEEANFESGQVVSVAFDCRDSAGIVEDFIPKAPFLVSDQLSSNAVHGKWSLKIDERSRDEVGSAGGDALGAARVHDELKVVVIGQKMALRGL